ncbi:hypothetical protein BT96DRAFT_1003958 [Gymnopus androsaceus JB14]|uniref:Uncharacterized protein n=1 Tax=Gymnopus androsaceus JB14 TaxID=1447944 RepID=A0A6A4GUA0_9AGAR|nr:hypothetical protein BT96DRAFT_1003958 [Gymnopus androsaceus JB14]
MADYDSSSEHSDLSTEQLLALLNSIQQFAAEPASFLISLARNAELSEAKTALGECLKEVLNAFKASEELCGNTLGWARKEMMHEYAQQLLQLMYSASGIRFSARNATAEHFESINIDDISTQMREHAPDLWDLLGVLLDANIDLSYGRRKEAERQAKKKKGGQVDEDDKADEDYWDNKGAARDQVNDDETEDFESPESQEPPVTAATKSTPGCFVCMSAMMQSTNQRCNALQSLIGLFLHACNAPETAVELRAHIGVSISTSAIRDAISTYAFDNIDMDLKNATLTLENALPTLIHLTSGTFLQLQHSVTLEDLQCADELWSKSKLNPDRTSTHAPVSNTQFAQIHPETPNHPLGLLQCERFIHNLREAKPEVIDGIPLTKSQQKHVQMMDTPCLTAAQKAAVLEDMASKQGGVGDPHDAGDNAEAKKL